MFSRGNRPRVIRQPGTTPNQQAAAKREKISFPNPVDELTYLFDRLSVIVEVSRKNDDSNSRLVPGRTKSSSKMARLLFRQRRGDDAAPATPGTTTTEQGAAATAAEAPDATTTSSTAPSVATPSTASAADKAGSNVKKQAMFVNMVGEDEEECIEIIRRIAELVVIGERVVASHQAKEDKRKAVEQNLKWGEEITDDNLSGINDDLFKQDEPDAESFLPIFETFFEQNGLAMLVDIVTGTSFQDPVDQLSSDESKNNDEGTDKSENDESANQDKESEKEEEKETEKEVQKNPQDSGVNDSKEDKTEEDEKDEEGENSKKETEKDEGGKTDDSKDDALTSDATKQTTTPSNKKKQQQQPKGETCTKLPPMRVATQAIQSVSILVQNVSRATSLYFILSNNHINELIDFPLERYSIAEANRLDLLESINNNGMSTPTTTGASSSAASSPELAELTTHFVTFLKSLALRMNAETLQFFLKYPTDSDRATSTKIEFPLYERALEFCSADHDSFVRITAMNICMNTLRLSTVVPTRKCSVSSIGLEVGDDDSEGTVETFGSSPDGVLHNAKPLPARERLAIAQHTCAPARVNRLVAPIFTKLATLWSTLEEEFMAIDSNKADSSKNSPSTPSGAKTPTAGPTKNNNDARKKRHLNTIRDIGADIQDQLLVLEDVLKVGLIALNEQIIEMMLATFVYPLLLQPILLYFRRLPLVDTEDPFSGKKKNDESKSPTQDNNDGDGEETYSASSGRAPPHVSAPAKTAFFTLAAVFQFITNRPLLRLLFTALFHPLLPDSSSETIISPDACVTYTNEAGETKVRIDEPVLEDDDGPIPAGRTTYLFGGKGIGSDGGSFDDGCDGGVALLSSTPSNKTSSSTTASSPAASAGSSSDNCIFVLSPALANLLRLSGEDIQLLTNLQPNPYRKAIMQALVAPFHMSDLGQLAVSTVDVALSVFDAVFVSEILLGRDLRTFSDDIPSESSAHGDVSHYDDFGMCSNSLAAASMNGSVNRHSDLRMSRNIDREDLLQDTALDVVTSLCDSVIIASPGPFGTWKLQFDEVAAHSLLYVIWRDRDALSTATKRIERRLRQSASLFAEIPPRIPTSHHLGAIVYSMFYELGSKSVIEDLLQLDPSSSDSSGVEAFGDAGGFGNTRPDVNNSNVVEGSCLHSPISCQSTFDDLCLRAVNVPSISASQQQSDDATADEHVATEVGIISARSLLKLDALATLLMDLADSECLTISKTQCPSGLAFSRDGTPIETTPGVIDFALKERLRLRVFSSLSDPLWTLLTNSHSNEKVPSPGQLVQLTGLTAIPCVCEAKSNGENDTGNSSAKIVAEGITWQSLYLVFSGSCMLLAEPDGVVGGGDGRVVASAHLSRLSVEKDKNPPESTSPARRLLVRHEWLDSTPAPGLFTVNARQMSNSAKKRGLKFGPLCRISMLKSGLDVWFENQNTCDHAYRLFRQKSLTAKTRRGDEILDYFSQNQL